MSDKQMEKEIIDKGLTYPRITNDEIELQMKSVKYHCHLVPGTTTTVITAYIPMKHINFTLATEIMACVDPRNFNKELGEKYGIEKAAKSAKDKLWELEGYRLAHGIASVPDSHVERMELEHKELFDKASKLNSFIKSSPMFQSIDNMEQDRLVNQSCLMVDYLNVLEQRINQANLTG